MARPSNKEERRQQIAQSLIKVMAVSGYDGASINKVAAEAGLAQGLVHYHFRNKQEILLAVIQELVRLHDQGLEQHLAEFSDKHMERLHAFIDFHLGLGTDANPESLAAWLVVCGEAMRRKQIGQAFEKAIAQYCQLLQAIIVAGVKNRQMKCADPKAAAAAIMATIQGYYVLAATARQQIPRGSAAKCTKEMAQGLVQPTGLTKSGGG